MPDFINQTQKQEYLNIKIQKEDYPSLKRMKSQDNILFDKSEFKPP